MKQPKKYSFESLKKKKWCFLKVFMSVFLQVKTVHCKPGDTVGEGDLLVELE